MVGKGQQPGGCVELGARSLPYTVTSQCYFLVTGNDTGIWALVRYLSLQDGQPPYA